MNGIKIDLGDFARVLYPGIILWLFINWRYSAPIDFIPLIFLALVLGILIYAVYRGIIYYPIIRWIEDKTVRIPQFQFYRSVVTELKASGRGVNSMENAAACAVYVLLMEAKPEFRAQLYRFNSFVHVPFITSFLAFCVFVHDLYWHLQSSPGYEIWWWWILVCIIFLWVGIAFDRLQSDPREAAFLRQHKSRYSEFIHALISKEGATTSAKRQSA